MGRKRLATYMGIGEGSVRTVLNYLKKNSLVKEDRSGCSLTDKGKKLSRKLAEKISEPVEISFTTPLSSKYCTGIIVRGAADRIKTGIEERDEAIRAGAKEALILTYERGSLMMPKLSNLSKEQPQLASRIISLFSPTDGDVIIITGADDPNIAKYATLAVAFLILKETKFS